MTKKEKTQKNKDADIAILIALVGLPFPIIQPVALIFGYRGYRSSTKSGIGKSKSIIAIAAGGLFTAMIIYGLILSF